jgi:hypothetical protein
MDKRLARMEQMLREALSQVPPAQPKRIAEKEVIAIYGVSRHVLRRLRLGYKRNDGAAVPPMLFNWGHRNGRDFDYDREEVDKLLSRTLI